MPTAASVEAYRTLLATVGEAALTDIEGLWRGWPWDAARGVRDAAALAVPDVVWAYQDVTGGLAADQYDTWREEARVRGRFTATPAQVAAEDQILAGVRNAIGPLFGADPDAAAARALLSGMVTRLVTHGSADTMVGSVRRDPAAVGWSRHTRAGGCGFCRMLQGRGSVYRKQETAVFAAHDHCRCTVAPSWDPDAPVPVREQYLASQRSPSNADRARVRAYLAEHFPDA